MLYNNQEGFFMANLTREEAWKLVKEYNKDPFHLRHALTVEGVMRWYANELGHWPGFCTTLILKCTRNSTALNRRKLCANAA